MKIKTKKILSNIIDIILIIAIIVSIGLIVFKLTCIKVVVIGNSMNPSICDGYTGYMVKVNKNTTLKRFEVVAYERDQDDNLIKRILGLPNETVTIDTNKLIVNGTEIEQTFEFVHDQSRLNNTYVLGDDEYLIVGDNRKDTILPMVVNKKDLLGHGGFLNSSCTSYTGAVCTIQEPLKKWVWLNGKS